MEADTAALRKAAPNWSLAGDKQLLEMLQKIHQKIMTKCEEANVKLEAMVDKLDNASIDLQNVNNKFMALSNSQFVESRVYDDDVDVSTGENIEQVEPPKVDAGSEVTKLKCSLQRLEQMHEPVHILDSDSSDDEDDGRIILKPKEIYSHRPLPYIIGSQAWKNKWHAGLIQEESDSDSSGSRHDSIVKYNDEYSESEPETGPTDKLANRTISSSSMESELTSQKQVTSEVTRQPAKPADIAAELARRLGGQPLQLPASEPVPIETPPEPTTKKVYRVEKPAPTTVFPDEPPPLDDYQSYKSDYTDDDDIFAELHKKPNSNVNRSQNSVAKNLFGGLSDKIVDDLFGEVETRDNDIGNVDNYQDVKPSASGGVKSPLDDGHESVTEKPIPKQRPMETKAETEGAVKKPVGGISLFGTNKGAESIGAAILKRNQRKSSTSDEDTSNTENKEKAASIEKTNEEPVNKIIEDLFSKPSKNVTKRKEIRKEEPKQVKPKKDKIDLFSDNLFDDIDDIFTTSIVTKPKDNKPQKSIFDDDDLFADITLNKSEKHNDKSDSKNTINSNDDLFCENRNTSKTDVKIPSNPINIDKDDMISIDGIEEKVGSDRIAKQVVSKSLFDDDSEDDLFLDVKSINDQKPPMLEPHVKELKDITVGEYNTSKSTKAVNKDVSKLLNNESESKSILNPVSSKSQLESPSLFDDDEFDDLFNAKTKSSTAQSNLNNLEEKEHITNEDTKNAETIISNKTIRTKVSPQISDNIAVTRQNKLSENEITETCDIVIKSNALATENLISVEKDKSKILQSEENLFDINETLDQKQDTKTPCLTDVDVNSKKPEYLKHPQCLSDVDDNILPSDSKQESSKLKSTEPNILNDIFADMPPAFEKPLEPKKSKNVNALFDDDSDDEALFFKKNDAISDEKPELEFSSDRFRIFHDEPPEIDIDFSQKPLKSTTNPLSEIADDDLFGGSPILQEHHKVEKVAEDSIIEVNVSRKNVSVNEDDKITNVVDITKLIEDSKESDQNQEINVSKVLESCEENTKMNSTEDLSHKPEINETETFSYEDLTEETEPKKSIGKLKPMNFSINVNTLLPGASLKNSKVSEETDGQTISTKSNEELNLHSPEKVESKVVKSISFDGNPESEVLDNKLSKQRAKIQVKRRPSSRRARLEAVRKSRIELASDSTDNSSSFDEPPYKEIVNRERLEDTVDLTIPQIESSNRNTLKQNMICQLDNPHYTNLKSPSLPEKLQQESENFIDTKTTQADVKSKVVYILNDEDIFNDINPLKEDKTEKSTPHNKKVLNIVDDDDEVLFKIPNISTLGKTYENKTVTSSVDLKTETKTPVSKESVQKTSENVKDTLPKTKKSLFGDLSDDENELFGGSKKPTVQKTNIFDSDSEGELFIKSKRESKSTVELKKETVKGSLFGDESDDDGDLFGVKVEKISGNARENIQKPKEVVAKTSEPVFEDPLTMFGEDS